MVAYLNTTFSVNIGKRIYKHPFTQANPIRINETYSRKNVRLTFDLFEQ